MQERHHAFRDPTIPLVLGLAIVITLVVIVRAFASGDGTAAVDAPTRSAPPSGTAVATDPAQADRTSGTPEAAIDEPMRVRRPADPITKLHCVQLPGDTEITVVSYNVKSFALKGNAGSVAGVLRAAGADIVLIQEIKNGGNAGNQPAALAGLLGMEYAFAQNVAYGRGGYGTAVLSRYPVVSAQNTHLPRPGSTQQRGLAHVVVDVDGKELSVYNTHLQNRSEPARMQQIRRIAQIVSLDDRPRILGGDMNAHAGSPVMGVARTVFTDTWATVGTGDGRTHPSTRLRGRIDYLMHGGDGITAVTSDVLPATLSDHRAVRARYVVEGPGGQECTPTLPGEPVPEPGQGSD